MVPSKTHNRHAFPIFPHTPYFPFVREAVMLYTATQLGKEFGIDAKTVGSIFASLKVKRLDREYNLGLKIKSTSRNVSNPKFAKYRNGKWHYSEDARSMLKEYVTKFPQVVYAVRSSSKGMYFELDDDEILMKCYEWAKAFRSLAYKRIHVITGQDLTSIK